jgi:hypothetical protein
VTPERAREILEAGESTGECKHMMPEEEDQVIWSTLECGQ